MLFRSPSPCGESQNPPPPKATANRSTGSTTAEQWFQDLGTGQWTHTCTYDTGIKDNCFIGGTALFLENFNPARGLEKRLRFSFYLPCPYFIFQGPALKKRRHFRSEYFRLPSLSQVLREHPPAHRRRVRRRVFMLDDFCRKRPPEAGKPLRRRILIAPKMFQKMAKIVKNAKLYTVVRVIFHEIVIIF